MAGLAVSDRTVFSELTLMEGTVLEGEFRLCCAHGDLQRVGGLFVTDGVTVVPLGAVLAMKLASS